MVSPCDWPLSPDECCETVDGINTEIIENAISTASNMMTRLSGYTIGQCSGTIRPLTICGECRGYCCGGADGIRLIGKDARQITQVSRVRLGPDVYPVTDWRFDEETQMLWHVPPGTWPHKDARWDEDGTGEAFSVDVIMGAEPDAWARAVGTLLACELVRSCTNQKCRLPKNATSVSSQGVTVTLSDADVKALLPEVAGWVAVVNPYDAVLPARMFSPDLAHEVRGGGGCCGC